MTEWLDPEFFADWGAWFHVLTMVLLIIDGMIPVMPGEVFVLSSGVLAAESQLSLTLTLITTFIAAFVGDLMVYLAFRNRLGQAFMATRIGAKVGETISTALDKAGPAPGLAAMFTLRFVSGGRTASMAACGMTKVRWSYFLTLSLAGSLVWTGYMVGLGWFTQGVFHLPFWISIIVGVVVGAVFGSLVGLAMWWARRRKATDAEEQPNQ